MEKIKAFFTKIKGKLIIAGLLILVLISVYGGYKIAEVRLTEKLNQELVEKDKQRLAGLKTVQIDDLKELTKSYTVYLRKPMLANDTTEVSIIANKLIAKSDIIKYVLINDEDIVSHSSDKNFIGKPAGECLNSSFLNLSKQKVESEENLIKVATPIVGLNDMGGLLYIEKVVK